MNDSLPIGCLIGAAIQIAFVLLAVALAAMSNAMNMGWGVNKWMLISWGVTQWIALVPLILQQKSSGHRRTMQGLLIAGCLGTLLGSSCAAIIFATTRDGM